MKGRLFINHKPTKTIMRFAPEAKVRIHSWAGKPS